MPSTVESLFWISLCAVLAPLVAGLVFRHRVPEVVILLVRGGSVYVASRTERSPQGAAVFDRQQSLAMALFGSTGLPIIVAVTSVAVAADQMSA